jgi:ASC-1-like (ASCH) protein
MGNTHLVILRKEYVEAILDGRKTIESRFTMNRRAYWEKILYGDRLFIKQSSGLVCATAEVTKVRYYEGLTPERIEQIKKKYNHLILGEDEYWRSKRGCRYGVLVWLGKVKPIEPIWIDKRDWRAWVVLSEKENFGLLKVFGWV